MIYANASYKHTHHKPSYQQGLWCLGHIKPIFYGDDLYGHTLYDTDHRYKYQPIDLDEERAVKATDQIIARLLAV